MAQIDVVRLLVGRKVRLVRRLNQEEMESNMWIGTAATALEFDDGTIVYASQDPEMNGPGALLVNAPDGKSFGLV